MEKKIIGERLPDNYFLRQNNIGKIHKNKNIESISLTRKVNLKILFSLKL